MEDSGSFININPALAICTELKAQGRRPLVLTSSLPVRKIMQGAEIETVLIAFDSLPARRMNALQNEAIRLAKRLENRAVDALDRLFADTIQARLHSWLRDMDVIECAISGLFLHGNIAGMLTIGPPSPLAILAGKHWRRQKHFWVHYFPALINASLEDRFFPADHYLVYGTHATDVICASGFPADRIIPVGSTELDAVFNVQRNRQEDRQTIEELVPQAAGKKLVVLGTERRPGELEEVATILEEIAAIDDIFVIVKIHPDQSPVPFEKEVARIAPDRMKVIHHCDLHALLNGSDLLLCSASNLNLLAAVFKTPALVITLSGAPYRVDFPKEGLCMKITDQEEIAPTVGALLFDEKARQEALAMYDRAIVRFNQPHDGRSVARVVAHFSRPTQSGIRDRIVGAVSGFFRGNSHG